MFPLAVVLFIGIACEKDALIEEPLHQDFIPDSNVQVVDTNTEDTSRYTCRKRNFQIDLDSINFQSQNMPIIFLEGCACDTIDLTVISSASSAVFHAWSDSSNTNLQIDPTISDLHTDWLGTILIGIDSSGFSSFVPVMLDLDSCYR